MIITPLGHTEFLVDIENSEKRNVRIMVDTWLSDYAIGDLMERTVKVKLDAEKLKTLDAIYISHAHCDHFDPYTLTEIYGARHSDEGRIQVSEKLDHGSFVPQDDENKKPVLILPFTMKYLEGVLQEYLPNAEIVWLEHRKSYMLQGIEITGYMWPNPVITNEDDVMMLAISSERELVFAEIDTVPDMEDEEVQKALYKVFTRKEYETACYLASRNCLEGQIPYYDVLPEKRKAYRDQYIATQKEEIAFQYERYEYEEFAHHPNLFALPGFVRGFIGQGIAYPSMMSNELYSLSLFPLDEYVSIEHDYAKNNGYNFIQKALIPGRQYKIENGGIEAGRKECGVGELIKNPIADTLPHSSFGASRRIHNAENPGSFTGVQDDGEGRVYAENPLIPRELTESEILEAKKKILEILNTRFLPYWSASPVASLRDALIKNSGTYRMEFNVSVIPAYAGIQGMDSGTSPEGQKPIIFEYSTAGTGFIEVPFTEKLHIDEEYWLLDILDFLEGRLEMYSSFWHALDPKKVYRLWTCLGANFCNNELVERKYRYHFERAKNGGTARDFVERILDNL